MGFDDLFEQGHNHQKHGHDHHHGYVNDYQTSHYNSHNDIKQLFLSKLQNNPQLKFLLIIAAIIIIVVVIIVAILLIPLLMKLLNFVSQNGIQGLLDVIWKGTN